MKTKKSISDDIRAAIELRAYYIWEREGRPQGRGAEHWAVAEAEITSEQSVKKAAAANKKVVEKAPDQKKAVPEKPAVKTDAHKPQAPEKPGKLAVVAAKSAKTKKAVNPKKVPAHKA